MAPSSPVEPGNNVARNSHLALMQNAYAWFRRHEGLQISDLAMKIGHKQGSLVKGVQLYSGVGADIVMESISRTTRAKALASA
jgi:hypothetical protein